VASQAILAFLDGIAANRHELHSFMLARHGKVVAEGWWAPYGRTLRHTMYSMSKSFTSTAVGFAVTEGKLTVEDKVTSFFPDDLPEKVSENLAALKVKHLLTMAVGSEKEPTGAMVKEENWVKSFLGHSISHEPGSVFLYNSAATYLCSAIVQKLTGKPILEYLQPRLFDPLGIVGATWEACPRGINTGGWGLSVPTEALAKFGQLLLQKGQWQGREIIPAKWVEEATTFKIQQPPIAKPTRPMEQNDWQQGYGYQFWRCQHGGFRGDGAFGQYTIVLPELDAVIAMTGESLNMQGELDLVWEHLLPALGDKPLPVDPAVQGRLQRRLANLNLPAPNGPIVTSMAAAVSGKVFKLEPNDLGLQSAALEMQLDGTLLTLRTSEETHTIRCGAGRWELGETALPGTPPRIIAGGAPKPGTRHKVAAAGSWKDDSTFEMMWRYYETPHHDTVSCQFEGDQVKIAFVSSISRGKDSRPVLVGRRKA